MNDDLTTDLPSNMASPEPPLPRCAQVDSESDTRGNVVGMSLATERDQDYEPADLHRFRRQLTDLLTTLRERLPDDCRAKPQAISADDALLIQQLEASNGQLLQLCESFANLMAKQTAAEARLSDMSGQM